MEMNKVNKNKNLEKKGGRGASIKENRRRVGVAQP